MTTGESQVEIGTRLENLDPLTRSEMTRSRTPETAAGKQLAPAIYTAGASRPDVLHRAGEGALRYPFEPPAFRRPAPAGGALRPPFPAAVFRWLSTAPPLSAPACCPPSTPPERRRRRQPAYRRPTCYGKRWRGPDTVYSPVMEWQRRTLPQDRPRDPARVDMHSAEANGHTLIIAGVPGRLPALYRMDGSGDIRYMERTGTVKRIAPACLPPPPRPPGRPRLVKHP